MIVWGVLASVEVEVSMNASVLLRTHPYHEQFT